MKNKFKFSFSFITVFTVKTFSIEIRAVKDVRAYDISTLIVTLISLIGFPKK